MHSELRDKKLSERFYYQDPVKLAPKLLGKIIVRKIASKYLTGKIVETEAYRGEDDEAAHSFNGKTKRTEVMFRKGGYLYVYFTYGMHYCANIVCGSENSGAAVLIRAVEPTANLDLMSINRFGKSDLSQNELINLTNGPAKLCQAFGITKSENGIKLTGDKIFLTKSGGIKKRDIIQTSRIGISKAVNLPWRFYLKDNPYVSKR